MKFEMAAARRDPDVDGSLDEALIKARVKARLLGTSARVFIGRFELLRRLGQGGEGTVYEARDVDSGAHVALKRLHPAYSASGDLLKREFRALAHLVHPNLVTLHELFQVDGQCFYTMALVPGVDFLAFVQRSPREIGHARLRKTLAQLFASLDVLHTAGKIHRDLKPSNVLVRADGHLVILDYGLVLDIVAPSLEASIHAPNGGTPAYAAPEQVAGAAVAASDLYAAGVMLYLALTGELPFADAPSTLSVRTRAHHDAVVRPRERGRDVPADLDALCMALLSHDPAERPTAADARAWCIGQSSLPRSPSPRSSRPSVPPEVFVGRRELLSELHEIANRRGDAPVVVLLHGESGIGKSALVRRFCAERAHAGALLLSGRCYEREHLPYKALDAIVEALVRQLNLLSEAEPIPLSTPEWAALLRLFPAFGRLATQPAEARTEPLPSDAFELRRRAFTAVTTLFRTLSARREVVFAVDDLQWGDLDSVHLLTHLLGGDEAPPLLFIGVARSDEMDTSPAVQALRASDLGPGLPQVVLSVGPLSSDEATALLRTLLPGDAASTQRLHDAWITQASGVPFALHQLAEHARDVGVSETRAGWLREVVRLRAARCSPDARKLLDVLVVAGRPLETALALSSAGADPAAFHTIAELCGRKLARFRDTEHERCLEPYHDLIRAALTETVTQEETRAIHRSIVSVLALRANDQPEHLVEHLLCAGEFERAGRTAVIAAERASAQLAWNRAAELFSLARRMLPAAELRDRHLHERLASALAAASRHREAGAAFAVAGQEARSTDERRRLEGLAAQQQLRGDDYEGGIARIEGLLSEEGYRLPRSTLGVLLSYLYHRAKNRLIAWLWGEPKTAVRSRESETRMRVCSVAYAEFWAHEPMRASVIHAFAYRESLRARDRHRVRAISTELAQLAATYGPAALARAERLLATMQAMDERADGPYERAMRHLARAIVALQCRWQPREALQEANAADALFAEHCPGSHFERSWISTMREFSFELTGDLSAQLALISERQRRAQAHDPRYEKDQLLMSVPLALLMQDDPGASLSYVQSHWTPARVFTLVDYTAVLRISNVFLYRGEVEQARAALMKYWGRLFRSGLLSVHMIGENAGYHRARNDIALYFRTGARRLRRDAARVIARAQRYPPLIRSFYRLLHASLSLADGDEARCREALHSAIADSLPHGGETAAWNARYRLAQLDGDADALQAADAWFRARSVRSPEHWVALTIPGADSWRRP